MLSGHAHERAHRPHRSLLSAPSRGPGVECRARQSSPCPPPPQSQSTARRAAVRQVQSPRWARRGHARAQRIAADGWPDDQLSSTHMCSSCHQRRAGACSPPAAALRMGRRVPGQCSGGRARPTGAPRRAAPAAHAGRQPRSRPPFPRPCLQYKVKDMSQADFGRLEIELAEAEMPGLMACRTE